MEETVFKRSPRAERQGERKLTLKFRDRSIFLPKKFLIGREDDCDIALGQDALVSRRHAVIEFAQGEYCIRDLGSTNGTWVNGKPLARGERRPLLPGDRITIGKTEMTLTEVPHA